MSRSHQHSEFHFLTSFGLTSFGLTSFGLTGFGLVSFGLKILP
jgi:hypothetical protein